MKTKTNKTTKTATTKAAIKLKAAKFDITLEKVMSLYEATRKTPWVRGSSNDHTVYGISFEDGKPVQVNFRHDVDGVRRTAYPVTIPEAAQLIADMLKHESDFDTGTEILMDDQGMIGFMEMVAKQAGNGKTVSA